MNLYSTGMAHCVKVYSHGAENLFFFAAGGWVLVLVEILEFVKRDKSLKYGLVLLGRGVWGSSPRNFWKLRREMVHSGPLWAKNIGNTLINNLKKIQQKKVSLKKRGEWAGGTWPSCPPPISAPAASPFTFYGFCPLPASLFTTHFFCTSLFITKISFHPSLYKQIYWYTLSSLPAIDKLRC